MTKRCPTCGGAMQYETKKEDVVYQEQSKTVDSTGWWCTSCDEAVFEGNELEKVFGKWPGDESDEELAAGLAQVGREGAGPSFLSLRWLPPEEGGRAQPPIGTEYRGIARADDAEEAWSLRLIFLGSINRAEATFLSPEAPGRLGSTFWLIEGGKRVAEAKVVVPSFRPSR